MSGLVDSVNVGTPRIEVTGRGREITSAIWKHPVAGRVRVAGVNLEGDDQADRRVHGGPDQAVYAYAAEDTAWWEAEVGRTLGPGAFGENLTVSGVDVTGARVGERWAIGTTVLEVRLPRTPCYKLAHRMGDPGFIKRFARGGRPGAYLGIVREGELGAGDAIEVVERPDHAVTIGLMAEVYLHDHSRAGELLAAPALPDSWREWVAGRRAA
jgi:MOSC domain-containing protein YiiM